MHSNLATILIIVLKGTSSVILKSTQISTKSTLLDEETLYFHSIYRSIFSTSSYLTVKVIDEPYSNNIQNLISSFSDETEQNKHHPPIEFQTEQKLKRAEPETGCNYYFRVRSSNRRNFIRFSKCSIAYVYFIKDEETLSKILFDESLCIEHDPECDPHFNWHFIFVKKIQNFTNFMNPIGNNVLKVVRNAVLFVNEQSSSNEKGAKGPMIYILRQSKWNLIYHANTGLFQENSSQFQFDSKFGNYFGEIIDIISFMPILPKFVKEYRFSILRNEKSTYPGLMVAHEILKFVNATIKKFIFPRPKKIKNPNWITITGGIDRNQWKFNPVSRIIDLNYIVFVTAKPVRISRSFEFLIEPFTGLVWLGTIFSIVSIILGGLLISVVTQHMNFKIQNSSTGDNITQSSWTKFQALIDISWLIQILLFPLLDQSYDNINQRTAGSIRLRALISLWLLSVIILVNLYKSNIAAFLIQPSFTKPPETFKDLVDSKYTVYTVNNTVRPQFVAKLLSDKSGLPYTACFKLVKVFHKQDECFRVITTVENTGCVSLEIIVKALARSFLTGYDGKELYQLSKEKLYPDYAAMSISPSLPIKRFVDQVISYLDQGGMINKWSAVRTQFNSNLGRIKAVAEARNRSIDIDGNKIEVVDRDDIIYPIIILVTGCLGSFILLLYEFMQTFKRKSVVEIIM